MGWPYWGGGRSPVMPYWDYYLQLITEETQLKVLRVSRVPRERARSGAITKALESGYQ